MSRRMALVIAALAFGACSDDSISPVATGVPEGPAFLLHTVSRSLPDDARAQAEEALARDAFRRESRFHEAADPGYLFRSTRVPQAEIEAGLWPADSLYQLGGQLFLNVTFTPDMGFGGRDLPPIARVHHGRRGGPDATRCASCHWRGGPAGAGDAADDAYLDGDGDAQSSALARNPIALPGAGFVELLGAEMTAEIAMASAALADQAKRSGTVVRVELRAKGVSFGHLSAKIDGSLDTSELKGIDADLVVKPFGWKGNLPTLRDAVEDALLVHHGMESEHLVATAPKARIGSFGGDDPDGDGVTAEIEEGQVTALTLFIAMQEVPIMTTPIGSDMTLAWADGRNRFEAIGCAACHVASLPLGSTTFALPSRSGGPAVRVDLAEDGAEPRLARAEETGGYRVFLFSDLKRHDLGPALAEPRADRGAPAAEFLTRPLWGVARSRPYLHDARAATLEDAILLHGGEAQSARDAYAALNDPDRGSIRIFLTSLTRQKRFATQ
jgi:Di-haem oxidoreductase, putative peroxidase